MKYRSPQGKAENNVFKNIKRTGSESTIVFSVWKNRIVRHFETDEISVGNLHCCAIGRPPCLAISKKRGEQSLIKLALTNIAISFSRHLTQTPYFSVIITAVAFARAAFWSEITFITNA